MKIIQICNIFYPAPFFGTELVVYNIAIRAANKGYESVVITSDLESFSPPRRFEQRAVDSYKEIKIIRCRAYKFPKVFPIIIPSLMHIIRNEVEKEKGQVILHNHTYLSLNSFLSTIVRKFDNQIRGVHQPHYHPFPGGSYRGYLARRICDLSIGNFIFNTSDAIVLMSNVEWDTIKIYNRIDERRVKKIPHGIDKPITARKEDVSRFKEKYGIKDSDIVLLCVSRIGERIVDFFIRLMGCFDINVKVLIVGSFWGDVDERRIEHKVKGLRLENRIVFTGYLKSEDLPYAYSSATIFVKPAYFFEAFGIVFMEAMSYGLPIVTHNIGALPEIIEDCENGFLISRSDEEIDDFKQSIGVLIEDKVQYEKMKKNNEEKAKEYLWDNILDRYFELYEELYRESS